ncbi:MAG: hypothetical protein ACD_59C00130G0011 [uncultured bacterium]|nr:MAG: hypothetical protein ACD_59C00130G0011 [uncultured bacterium]
MKKNFKIEILCVKNLTKLKNEILVYREQI